MHFAATGDSCHRTPEVMPQIKCSGAGGPEPMGVDEIRARQRWMVLEISGDDSADIRDDVGVPPERALYEHRVNLKSALLVARREVSLVTEPPQPRRNPRRTVPEHEDLTRDAGIRQIPDLLANKDSILGVALPRINSSQDQDLNAHVRQPHLCSDDLVLVRN